MIVGVIGVIISLAILAIVYILLKWVVGYIGGGAPLVTIINIVCGVVAIIIVLRYLLTIL
jgi:hypothetical protein